MLQARNVTFQHAHGRPMSCPATAQLLSNTLYHRRFFPLYTFNLCAGLDEEGAWVAFFASFCFPLLLLLSSVPEQPGGGGGTDTTQRNVTQHNTTQHNTIPLYTTPPPLHTHHHDATTGKGAVYTYDAIGSYERTGYSCQGSGKDLMQPVLDNQLKAASPLLVPARNSVTELPLEQAVDLVKDAFVSAGERDIYTGDTVEILVITRDGVRREELELKRD